MKIPIEPPLEHFSHLDDLRAVDVKVPAAIRKFPVPSWPSSSACLDRLKKVRPKARGGFRGVRRWANIWRSNFAQGESASVYDRGLCACCPFFCANFGFWHFFKIFFDSFEYTRDRLWVCLFIFLQIWSFFCVFVSWNETDHRLIYFFYGCVFLKWYII